MANLPKSWLWPTSRLGEALSLLTKVPGSPNAQSPAPDWWIESAAQTLGFEAQPAETSYVEFERQLDHMGPALIAAGSAYLALLPGSRLLTPALKKVRANPSVIRSALCATFEAPILREIQETLDRGNVSAPNESVAFGSCAFRPAQTSGNNCATRIFPVGSSRSPAPTRFNTCFGYWRGS
jgi:hypothetical protein